MATLSAGNLVNLRTTTHRSSFYLSVFQPATILSALVNDGTPTRGQRSIPFDSGTGTAGQFAAIEEGQLLEVDTATGTEYVTIKSITGSQVSGTITIRENAIPFADDQVIRIKHHYPLVAIPPSIRSQVFYKDYSIIYSNQNSTPNPVTIIGSHLVGVLSAGSVAFSLNSSSSYAIAQGATISSRVWSCLHNGGGTAGVSFSSTVAANPTLTLTQADQYWLKCITTDSNGKTQSTVRAIWTYSTLEDAYTNFTVSSLSGDWNSGGWQVSLDVTGAVALSDFPDGALAVIHYKNYFDTTEGYVDLWGTAGQNIVCAGYIRRDQDNDNFADGTGKISFSLTTPDGIMDNMSEMGTISLNATASPNKWYQYASWMTVGRAVHHLLKWHSSVLETCDVLGLTSNTLGVKNVDFTEPSVLQMCNSVAFQRGHFAKIVSSRLGRLYFATDSQMLNTAGRAALDTVFTIANADISDMIDVVRQPEEVVAVSDLDGFSFNGTTSTPFISIMPGYRESSISYGLPAYRGTGTTNTKSQVLIDQTDSNEKIGRVFAQANNNPLEFRFTTPANYIGAFDIVPSIGWYNWGIIDADLKRNLAFNGKLLLCRNISHQIDVESGTVQTSVVFEPEAIGPDGIQGNYPVGYPTPKLRTPTWTQPVTPMTYGNMLLGYTDIPAGTDFLGRISDGVTLGGANTIASGISAFFSDTFIGVGALSATLGICAYYDGTDTVAATLTVSGTTITANATAIVTANETSFPALAGLSSTQAILCYSDRGDSGKGKTCVLDISGTTVTPGSIVEFESGTDIIDLCVVRLSATKAIVVYCDVNAGGTSFACVLDVSGSTVTANAPFLFSSNAAQSSIVAMSSTSAIITYQDASDGSFWTAPITGIGTSGSVGSAVQLDAGPILGWQSQPNVCQLDSSRAATAYTLTDGSMWAVAMSLSGSTVTAGSPVTMTGVTNRYQPVIGAIAANTLLVGYVGDASANGVYTRTVSASGTSLTDNNDEVSAGANQDQFLTGVILKAIA